MEAEVLINFIQTLGFPIVCVIALGWFAWKMVNHMTETNAKNMEEVQKRCKEREDKLYNEIKENREINAQAITTIQMYADRLTHIENDIDDVKKDVSIIKEKVE